jgi:ribosomal protein S18 acetylase RimI-like enzyme
MTVHIRPASGDDVRSITELYLEVADEVVQREPTVRHTPDRTGVQRRYEARVGDSERAVLVAVADASIVGFVDAVLLRTFDEGMYHAPGVDVYVEELIVSRASQRRGVGRSLMTAVERWAIEAGARMVTLDTHVSNRAGRGLYGAMGYRDIGVILAKNL